MCREARLGTTAATVPDDDGRLLVRLRGGLDSRPPCFSLVGGGERSFGVDSAAAVGAVPSAAAVASAIAAVAIASSAAVANVTRELLPSLPPRVPPVGGGKLLGGGNSPFPVVAAGSVGSALAGRHAAAATLVAVKGGCRSCKVETAAAGPGGGGA